MTKCVFFVRHCERAKRAWHSINLNANLPLDCHKFARSRFANSRNDKILVILSLWRSIHKFKVWICILKYGFFILNSKRALNSLDFSLVSLTQNDKSGVDFFCYALQPFGSPFYKRLKMTMPCRLCKSCIYKTLLCNKKRATYENLYFATNKNPTNAFDLSKVPKFQMVYENLLQKQNAKAKVTLWLERKFAKANQVSFVGNCVKRALQLCFCEILAFHNLAEKLQNLLKTLEIYGYFAALSMTRILSFWVIAKWQIYKYDKRCF